MITLRSPLLVLTALLLTWLSPVLEPSSIFRPDWTLIAVLLISVGRSPVESLLTAAVIGAAEDAMSASAFGTRAITLITVSYVVGKLAHDLHLEAGRGRLLLLVSAAFVASATARVVSWLSDTVVAEVSAAGLMMTIVAGWLLWSMGPDRRQQARAERGAW